ncbi:MAG: hypothetical protein KY450_03240 [Actinobacteria bacterium]|nr:hypothetical protein [Actinomycetota bacterium]
MTVDEQLARIARQQHGLLSRRQALDSGLSPSGIRTRLARGDWLLLRRSVYAIAGVQPSVHQAALAVCLAAGDVCWASHRTAAQLWGLEVPAPTAIEVLTLPAQRVRLEGVTNHRSSALHLADLTWCGLVPTTSVARTLVDCIPHLPGRRLAMAVDDARRQGRLGIAELAACAGRLDHGGGRHLVRLRSVLADRLPGSHPGGSRRELDLLGVLVRGGLPVPAQQHEVVVGGRRRLLDYAYPCEMVGIEWDGFAEHGLIRSTFDDDRRRGNDLAVAGWIMLHFTSNSSPAHIVERTAEALALRQRRSA